jgi:hypothetical protein
MVLLAPKAHLVCKDQPAQLDRRVLKGRLGLKEHPD